MKRPTFFRLVRQALKDAKVSYDKSLEEYKQKNKLLDSKSNWSLLESWIQKCNENPDLVVRIKLRDGTLITMNTYVREKVSMDKLLGEITIEE